MNGLTDWKVESYERRKEYLMNSRTEVLRRLGLRSPARSDERPIAKSELLGQSRPHQYSSLEPADFSILTAPLGPPLSIRGVAELIGCSTWTVRQKYLPAGLPYHRLTPNGKLIFYRNQIIRWLLREQQKRGVPL
jgi:hypothetical protein